MTATTVASPAVGSVPSEEVTIELVEVTKRYTATHALQNISLEAYPGEFLVLLGPSGCGKSTILKIIAGLEDATEGEVYINGKLVNYVAPKQRDVAMVFQNYALYPHMTVEQNIGFPLRMTGVNKTERRKRVVEVASTLELDKLLDKYPEQLSGGQRQRVALGRALIRNPVAFLLDEPLSNLDALLRVQMREELLKFHKRIGRTIVYVTHDQIEAMTMATRIAVMKMGSIQQVGTPRDVFMNPTNTFVATFVGSPQMNLLPGGLETSPDGVIFAGMFRLPLHKNFPLPANAEDASLGVRPEDIAIASQDAPDGIPGRVTLVEMVGSDTHLAIDVGQSTELKVRVPTSFVVKEGDQVRLKINLNMVHLFDSQGMRITAADA